MNEQFLQKIGIDPNQLLSQLLENMQAKNVEYSERIDTCRDETQRRKPKEEQRQT